MQSSSLIQFQLSQKSYIRTINSDITVPINWNLEPKKLMVKLLTSHGPFTLPTKEKRVDSGESSSDWQKPLFK